MICFIQESPLDFLIYYPIIKILTERKTPHIIYDVKDKTTIETIQFFSQNPNIKTIVNYGGSKGKLSIALLCQEHNIPLIQLHGDEGLNVRDTINFLDVIPHLAYQNYVCADTAMTFLKEEGILTNIGLFECPITHLARKSELSKPIDVLIVTNDESTYTKQLSSINTNFKTVSYDCSKSTPQSWKEIYSEIRNTKYIVSDSFIFDKPARYLNKHFFYLGSNVLDHSNLGISTHLISKKLEIEDYLKQSWSEIKDSNPKYGLQSLIQVLF